MLPVAIGLLSLGTAYLAVLYVSLFIVPDFVRKDELQVEHTPIVGVKYDKDAFGPPKYAHQDDSGADIHAAEAGTINPRDRMTVRTGIHLRLPPGYEVQVRSRSGLAHKKGVFVLNSPGTIDNGYTGEVCVIIYNAGDYPFHFERGDRLAQLVVAPVMQAQFQVIEALEGTDRADAGFGSTRLGAIDG